MNIYLIGGIAAALLGIGFYGGKSYEKLEVDALVKKANQQVITELVTVNKDNVELNRKLDVMTGIKDNLELQLSAALNNVKTITNTREIWREREAAQPDCAIWLAAPVPCRLRPADDPAGGKAGAGQGVTP